ncbi:MAG: alpha/beta hydrolase, partial [Archangium sp.]
GGGFTGGSRTNAYDGSGSAVVQFTTAGIAYITADYRLLENIGTETQGVRKCLGDAALALQFVRRWASVFNIDPARVATYGGSAGAGTSLWLAYHDDLAKPDAGTEIEKQSTRVVAAAALSTQATYDVLRWAPDVYGPEYPALTNDVLLSQLQLRGTIVRFYGLPASHVADAGAIMTTLTNPTYAAYRADADMLALMTPDDPPVFVQNPGANTAPGTANFDLLHHPRHALTVRNFGADAGVTVEADVDAYNVQSTTSAVTFLIDQLTP